MVEADYQKKYYQKHKDKLKAYHKARVTCNICGADYMRSHSTNHKKTKKHLKAKEEQGIKNIPTLQEINDNYLKISEKLNHFLKFD